MPAAVAASAPGHCTILALAAALAAALSDATLASARAATALFAAALVAAALAAAAALATALADATLASARAATALAAAALADALDHLLGDHLLQWGLLSHWIAMGPRRLLVTKRSWLEPQLLR